MRGEQKQQDITVKNILLFHLYRQRYEKCLKTQLPGGILHQKLENCMPEISKNFWVENQGVSRVLEPEFSIQRLSKEVSEYCVQ